MDFFTPHLTLLAEPDVEFTMHAVTLVPNLGFASAGVVPGTPPANLRLTPDVFSVLLLLRKLQTSAFVRPVLRTHRIRDLNLAGKTSFMAFVCLEDDVPTGQILGSASVPVLGGAPVAKNPPVIESREWSSWVLPSRQGPALHLAGVVVTPTPGFSVSMEITSPQGVDPRELLLDLVVRALPGAWPPILTPHGVRFQTKHHDYAGLTIFEPDGDATRIPVT